MPPERKRRRPKLEHRLTRWLLLVVLLLLVTGPATADRSTGTWTGALELRGNYYWEESTRVVAPSLDLTLEAPNGVLLNGHYLLDTITSASVAAGARVDVGFREVRHDVSLGAGYEFDLGEPQLLIVLTGRQSREPDYTSTGGTVAASLALDERATTLGLSATVIHDDIGQRFRGGTGPGGGAAFDENLNGFVLHGGWAQVLSPTTRFTLDYDFGLLKGFLSNAYRGVRLGGTGMPVPEVHPDRRLRHTVTGRIAQYIPATGSAVHLVYRAYMDSWDIAALTPEVRFYQELGAFTVLRFRYRYYTQTESFFYEDIYNEGDNIEFVTLDPKMSRFHSHLFGGRLLLDFDFLASTSLEALRRSSLELSFQYIWNTNSFGNGVISQVALRVPF